MKRIERTAWTLLLVAATGTAYAQPPAPAQPTPAQPTPTPPAPAPAPAPAPPAPTPDQAPPAPAPDQAPPAPAPDPTAAPPAAEPAPPPAAEAPVPDEIPPDDAAAEGEVIVVTGSRINDPLGKVAPVLSLSREDLERSGLHSVGDVLQQLTVSGGAINGKSNASGNAGNPPDGGGVGAGAAEADLRYLGSKRVLVLVDGVRWVNGSSGSGVSGATDLNTIPLAIIDRIEVLEDGASPIYGSDAIAGVINIITRKQFDGVTATAYTGGFHEGDGFVQKYDFAWGATTDRLQIVVSGTFLDQRTVKSIDRTISDSPTPGVDTPNGQWSGTIPNGRFSFTDPMTGMERDLTLGADGALRDFTNQDRFNFSPFNYVLTPSRRIGAFSGVTYKLHDRVNLRGKAAFTNRQSVNQAAPEPLVLGPQGANGNRMDRISVDVTNPYNPFGFTFDANTMQYVLRRRPLEAGPRHFEQNVDTFYFSGGLDGTLDKAKRWTWDATAAYGINRAAQRRSNSFNSSKLQNALGPAYLGSDNQYHCGVSEMQPGDPECVPFNWFGGAGTITPEMLKYVTYTQHDVSEQKITDLVANVAGQAVKLPGGWLGVAAGVEHRRLNGFFEPDSVVTAADSADVPAQPLAGDYSVTEGYAEVRIPVVQKKPGAELIDLNAAARISKYSFLDTELTAKGGIRWKPTADLVLRGSYGQGFRAPSIGELFGTEARFDATLTDPCSDFNNSGVPQAVIDRCIALGVNPDGSYEAEPQTGVKTGGNRDLEPETSKSLNISVGYSPKWATDREWSSNLDLELAYYDVRLDKQIAPLDVQFQLDQCVLASDDSACVGITRLPGGRIGGFENKLQNLGGLEVRGFDLVLNYKIPMKSFGRFRVGSQTSFLMNFWEKVPILGGFRRIEREGTVAGQPERAFPRLKSQLALGWFYKRFDVTLTTRYIHSVTEPCVGFKEFPDTCSDFNDNDALSTNKLGATVYNDIQVLYSPEAVPDLVVTVGVNNFTNREPPACFSCALNGFNPTTYDVPGIFGYLTAAYKLK